MTMRKAVLAIACAAFLTLPVSAQQGDVEVVADGLNYPWSVVSVDGTIWLTEKGGKPNPVIPTLHRPSLHDLHSRYVLR
jgi:hypothetical protein